MNERLYFTTNRSMIVEPIEELSRVSLLKDADIAEGCLPAGTKGTVVLVHGSGEAYCIEFTEPFQALLTLLPDDVEAVKGESRADLTAALDPANRHS